MTFKKTLMGTFIVLFFLHFNLSAQPRRPVTNQVVEISEENAAERWLSFVMSKQADNFFFSFELKHIPRRDKEFSYFGDMLAKRIEEKYYTRLRFKSPDEKVYDYLFVVNEDTAKSEAFRYNANTRSVEKLEGDALLKPLAEGLIYTPFDLLMNYKYWDWKYLKAGRIAQAVYFFKLSSPYDWLGDIEIALTREFNSPVQTQFFRKDGKLLRTFLLGSVKKINDYWIVKTAEIKDEVSKDKDKLIIQAANLKEVLDENLFKQESLGKGIDRILLEDIR